MGSDASDKGNRAILTAREKEILRGEADVSDNYYYRVISGVRTKINRLEHDLEVLDENHPKLANELRETVCDGQTSMTEIDINGWSVKRDRKDSIILTSDEGDVFANRSSQESTVQTWFVNADLAGQDPKSWKVTVESRQELIAQRLPEILHSLDNQS